MDNLEKIEPGESIDLGGKTLTLRYTMRSVAQYKRLTGKNLLGGQMDPTDAEQIIALVWCGLVDAQQEFDGQIEKDGTPSANVAKHLLWIEKSMKLSDVGPISEAIKRAFEQASPAQKEAGEKNE